MCASLHPSNPWKIQMTTFRCSPSLTQERFAAACATAAAAVAAAIARETAMEDPDDNVPLFTKDSFAYSGWRS